MHLGRIPSTEHLEKATYNANLIFKFTIVGQIYSNIQMKYTKETTHLLSSYQDNSLALNISKMKELTVDSNERMNRTLISLLGHL